MKNALIQAKGIKPYLEGDNSLPAINLNILPATIVSIIGTVSTGKNTWLKTLAGMLELEAGELILLGHNFNDMQRTDWLNMRKEIAYIGYDASLLSVLSIMENILLPASYHKLAGRNELIERARNMLFEVGFDDAQAFKQLPAYVNVTQRYYAMLVRAFMLNPKIIFIDDMFSQLDATASENINRFLRKRTAEGLAVVQNTHDIRDAIKSSTEILFVTDSNVLMFKDRDDLFASVEVDVTAYLHRYYIN